MSVRQYFYGVCWSTLWYIFYLIWEEGDFLWLGCLHTGLYVCIFFWLLFKAVYPKQTCDSSASLSIFQETELFPSSVELAVALYCLPWYSDASMETWRSYIFTEYRRKKSSCKDHSQLWDRRRKSCVLFPSPFTLPVPKHHLVSCLQFARKCIAPGQQQKALQRPLFGLQTTVMMEWWWWWKLPLVFKIKYGQPLFWLAAFSFCNWNSVRLRR